MCQTVMILLWMRDTHRKQGGLWSSKSPNRMERYLERIRRVQRKANVQYDPLALRFDLDASAADLFCS